MATGKLGSEGDKRRFWSKYFDPQKRPWPVVVRSIGYNRILPSDRNPMLKHPWHHWIDEKKGRCLDTLTLVHVMSGAGHYSSSESGEIAMTAGTATFVFPGCTHRYGFDRKTGWDDEWLEVDAPFFLPILESVGITPVHPIIELPHRSRLSLRFRSLFDLVRGGASPGAVSTAAYALIASLVDECEAPRDSEDPVEVMRVLLERSACGGIAGAASTTGLSDSRLRALFREKMGMSPKRYQLNVRLGRAAKLLTETKMSIRDIAEEVGFKSMQAFSTRFAAEYGIPPTAWRRRR